MGQQGILALFLIIGDVLVIAVVVFFLNRYYTERLQRDRKDQADSLIANAKENAKTIEIEAKDNAIKILKDAEDEITRRRNENLKEEERLNKRRSEIDNRIERLELRDQTINKRQSLIDKRSNELEKMYAQQLGELQRIAQMSVEEAREILLQEAEKEGRADMARIIRQIEAEARAEGEKRAKEIVADAIQRVASEHVNEVTTSVVILPNEEMKGRIVGRNGRNIRAFEQAAGVDVIVDDTPEAVTISCFDPVRREVARRALDYLILDGRIHPAHIEKVLEDKQKEVEKTIEEAGEQAAYDAGVSGIRPEILKVLGRLKYRTSYGQNQLSHAVEVARLGSVIASELGADIEIVKAAGLLHDLGKAMDHNTEGTHALIGAEFARRYGVNPKIVNAIASHHHETEQRIIRGDHR